MQSQIDGSSGTSDNTISENWQQCQSRIQIENISSNKVLTGFQMKKDGNGRIFSSWISNGHFGIEFNFAQW